MTASSYPGGGGWMVQNRGHAQFNSVYMLCPNVGPVFLHPQMKHPFDIGGGNSHIVDYLGNVMSYSASGYNTFVSAIIDIEALRQFRVMNLNSNWIKDLRTEIFRKMYDEPIHPKNLFLGEPLDHASADEVYRGNIRTLIKTRYVHPAGVRPRGRDVHPHGRHASSRGLGAGQGAVGRVAVCAGLAHEQPSALQTGNVRMYNEPLPIGLGTSETRSHGEPGIGEGWCEHGDEEVHLLPRRRHARGMAGRVSRLPHPR